MALAKGALWLISLWSFRVLARITLLLKLKELYGSLYRALGFLSDELYCIALDIGAQ